MESRRPGRSEVRHAWNRLGFPGVWEFSVGSAIGVNHDAEEFRIIARVIYHFDIGQRH